MTTTDGLTANHGEPGALLGLATTREILAELVARLEPHCAYVSAGGIEHEGHPERPVREAAEMAWGAVQAMLAIDEPRVLDYRTVDTTG